MNVMLRKGNSLPEFHQIEYQGIPEEGGGNPWGIFRNGEYIFVYSLWAFKAGVCLAEKPQPVVPQPGMRVSTSRSRRQSWCRGRLRSVFRL